MTSHRDEWSHCCGALPRSVLSLSAFVCHVHGAVVLYVDVADSEDDRMVQRYSTVVESGPFDSWQDTAQRAVTEMVLAWSALPVPGQCAP